MFRRPRRAKRAIKPNQAISGTAFQQPAKGRSGLSIVADQSMASKKEGTDGTRYSGD